MLDTLIVLIIIFAILNFLYKASNKKRTTLTKYEKVKNSEVFERERYDKNINAIKKEEKNYCNIDDYAKDSLEKKKAAEAKKRSITRENIKKGEAYEKYLAEHFRGIGYKVEEHGKIHGKKDKSIDLILKSNRDIVLVQAKNWKKDGMKITHKDIKAFVGETAFFIHDNPLYQECNIKRLFITSNDILDYSAKCFIEEHKEKIENPIINFKLAS